MYFVLNVIETRFPAILLLIILIERYYFGCVHLTIEHNQYLIYLPIYIFTKLMRHVSKSIAFNA